MLKELASIRDNSVTIKWTFRLSWILFKFRGIKNIYILSIWGRFLWGFLYYIPTILNNYFCVLAKFNKIAVTLNYLINLCLSGYVNTQKMNFALHVHETDVVIEWLTDSSSSDKKVRHDQYAGTDGNTFFTPFIVCYV